MFAVRRLLVEDSRVSSRQPGDALAGTRRLTGAVPLRGRALARPQCKGRALQEAMPPKCPSAGEATAGARASQASDETQARPALRAEKLQLYLPLVASPLASTAFLPLSAS